MSSIRTWMVAAVVLTVSLVPGAASAQTAGLTLDRLKNATYPSEYAPSGRVTLLDGKVEWNQPPLRGNAVFVDAKIGPDYAAVLIGSSTGGSGSFTSLHLVTSSAGVPTAGPGLFLGDRQRVESFTLEGDRVRLALLTAGPTDPLCCPTQRETREFVRDGGTFRLVSTAVTQPGSGPLAPPPSPPKTGTLGMADAKDGAMVVLVLALATVVLVIAARARTGATGRQ